MTTASKITLVRVAMIPLFMVCLYLSADTAWLTWASLAIFVIASLTDYVDGTIARKYNQVSDFGKFLDPLADKLLVISAMAIFCEWGIFPAWALMIVLTREFAVTGLRLVAVSHGRKAWWAAVHGVAQSRARLSDFTFTFHFHALEEDMATHSSVLA